MKKEKAIIHKVISNLNKIQINSGLTKSSFALTIGYPESKWNKISNGHQNLSIDELSNIAEKLSMREIDIYTYPNKYYLPDDKNDDVKVIVSLEVKNSIKSKVLKDVFGNQNIEILNK